MASVATRTAHAMAPEQPVQRTSLWQRERAGWYRDAARSHMAQAAGPLPFALLVCALFAYWSAWSARGAPEVLLWATAGAAASALAWGLFAARDWARRIGGGIAAVIATFGVIALVVSLVSDVEPPGRMLWDGMMLAVWVFAAFELLGAESTRRLRRAQAIAEGRDETQGD